MFIKISPLDSTFYLLLLSGLFVNTDAQVLCTFVTSNWMIVEVQLNLMIWNVLNFVFFICFFSNGDNELSSFGAVPGLQRDFDPCWRHID